MSDRIVYFMRGVYSCGKSTRAKEIAGSTGKVLAVDAYFETPTENGGIDYKFRRYELDKARRHVYRELKRAMRSGIHPIVIDRDNAPSSYTKKLVEKVIKSGYTPKLAEPQSDLWKNLRSMLENRKNIDAQYFAGFAQKLSNLSQETHRVSSEKILKCMMNWPVHLTIDDFLNFNEEISNRLTYIYEISDGDN